MTSPIFDQRTLALRQHRALKQGPRLFLAERTVEDIAERLSFIDRRFGRALLVGCPDPKLAEPLVSAADQLVLVPDLQELARFPPASFDLLITLGLLDTADELPTLLHILRFLLDNHGLCIGAFAGNNSLPLLRGAMLAADRASGRGVAPRTHPQIEASAFAGLLQDAGFANPIVDIDRVSLRYRALDALVTDLRGMAATNVLAARSRQPILREGLAAARAEFARSGDTNGSIETVEIIHFAAWATSGSRLTAS